MNLYAYVGGDPVNYIDLDGLQWCTPWIPTFQTRWREKNRSPVGEKKLPSYQVLKLFLKLFKVSKALSFYRSFATGSYDVIARYQLVTSLEERKYLRYCFATEPCELEDSWEEEWWRLTGNEDTWEEYIEIFSRPAQERKIPIYVDKQFPPT